MLKPRLMLAAMLAAPLVAGPCHAEAFCDDVAHIAALAPHGFGGILGEESGIGRFPVSYSIAGAHDLVFESGTRMDACGVSSAFDRSTGTPSHHLYYECAYPQQGDPRTYQRDAANVAKDALVARLAACLAVPVSAFTAQTDGPHYYGIQRNGIWYEVWSNGFAPAIFLRIETWEPPFSGMPNHP